ncbi:DNA adenine methylase [Terrisporobacter sp.]
MSTMVLPQPVLKWAGGKRQLLDIICPLIPHNIECYYEPFIGGGAVFLKLAPKKAVINDYNSDLINVYKMIKDKPSELLLELKKHEINHSEDYYYYIRSKDRCTNTYDRLTDLEKAARMMYLNKTCYNGLFRVNRKGEFNTPIGRYKNPNIANETLINALSGYLNNNNIKILNGDYKDALKYIEPNSFVYLDPPYEPLSKTSSFTEYTDKGFNFENQKELKVICDELTKQGIKFLQSNSDNEKIRELYKDYNIKTIEAKRFINSNAHNRVNSTELLIYNYNI